MFRVGKRRLFALLTSITEMVAIQIFAHRAAFIVSFTFTARPMEVSVEKAISGIGWCRDLA